MRIDHRSWMWLVACALSVVACGEAADSSTQVARALNSADEEPPTPGTGYVAPPSSELRGLVSTAWVTAAGDVNRCLTGADNQVATLRQNGEVLGFRMGAGYPAPYCEPSITCWHCCLEHWQGLARVPVGDGRHLAVSSSNFDEGARVALVRFATKRPDRLRLRANRLSTTAPDWRNPPPAKDAIVNDLLVDPSSDYNHPGGMQAVGRYLFVAVERIDGSKVCVLGECHYYKQPYVAVYDLCDGQDAQTCDPSDPTKRKLLHQYPVGWSASWVGATKLADGRYLMVVGNSGEKRTEYYVSRAGASLGDPTAFAPNPTVARPWSDDGFGDYQSGNFLTSCENGQLYLLGTHYTGADLSPGEDWADLWAVHLYSGSVSLVKVANRHLVCGTPGGKQCELAAAAGAYVDPNGRLLLYATEHDDDGPVSSVKMKEFAGSNPVATPCTTENGWVELFTGADWTGRSLVIDYVDRARRNYDNFNIAAQLNDQVLSARWCLPPGTSFRLWPDYGKKGTPEDLAGTGGVNAKSWGSSLYPWWSSGCFASGASCVAAPVCDPAVCTGAYSSACPADCQCGHSPCTQGVRLAAGCDTCVGRICEIDPYCCTGTWDGYCTAKVASVCGASCP